MVDGINGISPASDVLFTSNLTNRNIDEYGKNVDIKREERDDRVKLSTQKTESTQSSQPREERSEIENEETVSQAEEAARRASEAPQKEPAGTRVDIFT